jgi:hypothetical protein
MKVMGLFSTEGILAERCRCHSLLNIGIIITEVAATLFSRSGSGPAAYYIFNRVIMALLMLC